MIVHLDARGITASDLRFFREATANNVEMTYLAAELAINSESLASYHAARGKAAALDTDDLRAVAALVSAGYPTVHDLINSIPVEPEAIRYDDAYRASPIVTLANLIARRVPPERIALASRCGIPVSAVHEVPEGADPWEFGATYRAKYEEEEVRMAKNWGHLHGKARTWKWTRETAFTS